MIVGVEVVTTGSDLGQLAPMVEQVAARCEASPQEWLVDGGYPAHEQVDAVSDKTVVYAPVPKPKDDATDPYAPKATDSDAVAAWRKRMGGDGGMRERASAKSRIGPAAGARTGQGQVRGNAVCPGAQPDAHGRLGAGDARPRDRYVHRGRSDRMKRPSWPKNQQSWLKTQQVRVTTGSLRSH